MNFNTYKSLVVAKATKVLWDEPWFSGIPVETIRESYRQKFSVEAAVEIAIDDARERDEVRDGE